MNMYIHLEGGHALTQFPQLFTQVFTRVFARFQAETLAKDDWPKLTGQSGIGQR
jgi:hypothetical protein